MLGIQFVVDHVTWIFWFTVYWILRLLNTLARNIIPTSLIKEGFVKVYHGLGIHVVEGKENAGKYDKKKYACEFIVNNPAVYGHLAFDGAGGLIGDAYMKGWWDTDDGAEVMKRLMTMSPSVPMLIFDKHALALNEQTMGYLSSRVVDDHYNLGNDLYINFLGPTMNYTCGLWYPETKTLEEAQINKMNLVGRKLKLKPGMKVLDIGCGFGAAAKYMAETFGVSVTGYNLSKEQLAYARESVKGTGLDVTFVEADYRTATGQYDAVYSIGCLEHVGHRNYRAYFELVDRCLKPGGITLVHTIVICDRQPRTERWLNTYLFPGGELPYVRDLVLASQGLFVTEDIHSFAKSYAPTLREWRVNWEKNWPNIEAKYKNYQDGMLYRMFYYYFFLCEGGFKERTCQLYQAVYTKYPREAEYISVRDKRE